MAWKKFRRRSSKPLASRSWTGCKRRGSVRITRYGKPVADIVPAVDPKTAGKRHFGTLAGKLIIKGDIVSPAFDVADWDCLKD